MSQYGYATEPSEPLGSGAHGNDPAAEVGIMRVTVAPPPLQSAVVNVVIDHITQVDVSASGQGDGSGEGSGDACSQLGSANPHCPCSHSVLKTPLVV